MTSGATRLVLRPGSSVPWTLGMVLLGSMGCGGGAVAGADGAGGRGGGGGAGGAEATTSTGGGIPCGPSAQPCGAPPCDPDDPRSCDGIDPSARYACQPFGSDCSLLDEPRCVQTTPSPHCGNDRLACTCRGDVVYRDCAGVIPVAPDPASCSLGTFACGTGACRLHVEVCVTAALDADDGACVVAAELGCTQYGIADCGCLVEGERTCVSDGEPGAVFLVAP